MIDFGDEFWSKEEDELRRQLLPIVIRIGLAAAETALAALQMDVSVGVDWTLINNEVQKWAFRYTYDLVKGITNTTRDFLSSSITDWISSGQPLDALTDVIEQMFGPVRASLIAATEVTRAYAEGNQETWRASGVVDGIRWMTAEDELVCPICAPLDGQEADLSQGFADGPPAHPNCRCYLQPVVKVD